MIIIANNKKRKDRKRNAKRSCPSTRRKLLRKLRPKEKNSRKRIKKLRLSARGNFRWQPNNLDDLCVQYYKQYLFLNYFEMSLRIIKLITKPDASSFSNYCEQFDQRDHTEGMGWSWS